jgi:hypothetical protein
MRNSVSWLMSARACRSVDGSDPDHEQQWGREVTRPDEARSRVRLRAPSLSRALCGVCGTVPVEDRRNQIGAISRPHRTERFSTEDGMPETLRGRVRVEAVDGSRWAGQLLLVRSGSEPRLMGTPAFRASIIKVKGCYGARGKARAEYGVRMRLEPG